MKKNIRIMIIDDDPDDRELFIQAVAEIDANIVCMQAKDGLQALEMLRSETSRLPDYIFLDLRLPRISGKKCLLELKSDSKLKDIPVIVYTTSREVEDSKELRTLGAVQFISKPADPQEIYYLISCTLEEQLGQPKKPSSQE